MIIEHGQFFTRLDQLKEAFSIDEDVYSGADRICFRDPKWKVEATLFREGEKPFEPVRMIRSRTAVTILDAEGGVLWSNVKGETPTRKGRKRKPASETRQ